MGVYIDKKFDLRENPPNLLLQGTSCGAILVDVQQKFYWTSSRKFIAFLDEISNSKTFEAYLQNSSGRLVESYWTSSRIQWTSNRSSMGCPLDQMIWANISRYLFTYYIQSHGYVIRSLRVAKFPDSIVLKFQFMNPFHKINIYKQNSQNIFPFFAIL